jgi:Ca-activated chloride channel family protein
MLTFAYPWLGLLALLPLAVIFVIPPYERKSSAVRVPFLERLSRATNRTPREGSVVAARSIWSWLGLWSVWFCLVAALARPQWLEPPLVKTLPTRDLLLAVDLSGSMSTKDFTDAAGNKVDRLTAVKQVLRDFLKHRQGDRVGLIVFGDAPFVQIPFTQDLAACEKLLDETQVGMAGPKTAFGDALGLAMNVFEKSSTRERVLIALTDGNDTGSLVPPAKAAEIAKDRGIVIYTIAVGDPHAAGEDKLDEVTLRQVAKLTGGEYSHAGNRQELSDIYARLDKLPTRPVQTMSQRRQDELYHWPLAAAVSLAFVQVMIALLMEQRSRRTAAPRAVLPGATA